MLTRTIDAITTVAADWGYDWEIPGTKFRAEGIKPLIPTRENDLIGHAKNHLHDDSAYHLRSEIKSVAFGLKRWYGDR